MSSNDNNGCASYARIVCISDIWNRTL